MDGAGPTFNPFKVPSFSRDSSLVPIADDVTLENGLDLQPLDPLPQRDLLSGSLSSKNPQASSVSSGPDAATSPGLEDEIWTLSVSLESLSVRNGLQTWESCHNKTFEPITSFMSEQPIDIYDAILAKEIESNGCTVRPEPLLQSLLYLGLGRESLLYSYDESKRAFRTHLDHGRMPSLSLESFQSVEASTIHRGNTIRQLQLFVDRVHVSKGSLATKIAVAREVSSMLSTVEAQVLKSAPACSSILQVQAVFDPTRTLHVLLASIVEKIEHTNTEIELLGVLFEKVKAAEHEQCSTQASILQLLNAAVRPWKTSIGAWLGMPTTMSCNVWADTPPFVQATWNAQEVGSSAGEGEQNWHFDPAWFPSFLGEGDARTLYHIGQSLRILRAYQPDHPLFKSSSTSSTGLLGAEWQHSWHFIDQMSRQARLYEMSMREAIACHNARGSAVSYGHTIMPNQDRFSQYPHTLEDKPPESIQDMILSVQQPLPDFLAASEDQLDETLSNSASGVDDLTPPLALVPTLALQPVAAAQGRLVNQACTRLLFRQHQLRSHFDILHRYQLLGDGPFTLRLSHALFDPELASAERRKGHHRVGKSGLQLGFRDSWPPASSELRLALTGILTESYFPNGYAEQASLFRDDLPGGLSFAIREMSDSELRRCIDPNSIYALDFLKIQYRAPSPLNNVITRSMLLKYETIFSLLLRVKRVVFVLNQASVKMTTCDKRALCIQMWCLRYRHESYHFASSICTYFFDSVTKHWERLQRKLDDIELAVDAETETVDSIFALQAFHEQFLDRTMLALFLHKRQTEVLKLLEDIFGLILRRCNPMAKAGNTLSELEVREAYASLQKKIVTFVQVCRGLNERRGEGGTSHNLDTRESVHERDLASGANSTMGDLLLRFEMNDFYKR